MVKEEPGTTCRAVSEGSSTDDGEFQQKHSVKIYLNTTEISDQEDDNPGFQRAGHGDKEQERPASDNDVDCSEKRHEKISGSSVEVLRRIFPQHNPSILEMILKAYDNDLVRATESLMLENGMLRFPTPPISPEESSPPSVLIDSEESPKDARRSAFSPVSTKIVPLSTPVIPPSLPPSTLPPLVPGSFATRSIFPPYVVSRRHHVGLPFHPYMRRHVGRSALHPPNMHESRQCGRCANWILSTDRFCSHCGKSA